ncbi:entericidin A/B family lipoprotein [Guyparkeria hydrothermalis]|uniref:entericidin A/B family lipoprotein n=1 Tax=Guyparkeria hydrothermalis TaxID=923 RepID=UPI00202171DE|nr:entericidin A/B family lipoprotein [Guyparkeria hydrothermalis]MCL7743350.1 entericidin A/B family lipoprotein [Guyparkeria hydrothermalis]
MMTSFLKRMSLLAALIAPMAILSGCNTVEGLGEDTQDLGESIDNEAEEHD